MTLTDFEDETKLQNYLKEIYNNDTWLIHKRALDEVVEYTDRYQREEHLEPEAIPYIIVEEGQLYLMKDNNKMYFYYYLPKKKTTKIGEGKGFLIYIPTVRFKKVHQGVKEWAIYYEKLKMLKNYTVSVTKITNIFTQNQLINWNKLPWGDKQ